MQERCCCTNVGRILSTLFYFFFSTNNTTTTTTTTTHIFYQWTAWRAMSPFLPLGVKLTHFCARAKPSHRVTKRRSWNKRKSKDS